MSQFFLQPLVRLFVVLHSVGLSRQYCQHRSRYGVAEMVSHDLSFFAGGVGCPSHDGAPL